MGRAPDLVFSLSVPGGGDRPADDRSALMRNHKITITNAASLMLERLAFRVALWLSLFAWAELAYCVFTGEWITESGETFLRKQPDVLSVLGLLCAAVASACSAYYVKRNIDQLRAWLFAVWCFAAFLGLMFIFVAFPILKAWH